MAISPLAGKPAPRELLVNVPHLVSAYYTHHPDPAVAKQRVAFGTSGHRGSSLSNTFNEDHVLAICQATCEYRQSQGIDGPLYLGMDTHALSEPAFASAVEVFAANGVNLSSSPAMATPPPRSSPTPSSPTTSAARPAWPTAWSSPHPTIPPMPAALNTIRPRAARPTPPPPAPSRTAPTRSCEGGLKDVRRIPFERALKADTTHAVDYIHPYLADLKNIIDMEAIAAAHLKIGVDPLGGASVAYWAPLAEMYGLDLEVVNPYVDPTFAFMTVDHDGKIRMDCSSPYAMASLIRLKDQLRHRLWQRPRRRPPRHRHPQRRA